MHGIEFLKRQNTGILMCTCNMAGLILVWLIALQTALVCGKPDSSGKATDQISDRSGRTWLHAASSPQTLQQLQQNQPPLFLPTSTNKPGDSVSSGDNGVRHFDEQDKTAIPAASEQDFLSRHYGYMNIHRFDPNFPFYERPPFPRFPSPHTPRFGPGYRKDKYGHGYGYSCKQGDDCDEVRAANQIPPLPPPRIPPPHHGPLPAHHSIPPPPFNNHFPDVSAYPNLPPYPSLGSFTPYASAGIYPPAPPARFNDLHMPLPHSMPRLYHGRYLHEDENKGGDKKSDTTQNEPKDATSKSKS